MASSGKRRKGKQKIRPSTTATIKKYGSAHPDFSQPVEILFPQDVMRWWTGTAKFPVQLEPYIKWDEWTWYCNQCLVKQTWDHFARSKTGWPLNTCRTCVDKMARIHLFQDNGTRPKQLTGNKHAKAQSLAASGVGGTRTPTASEAFAKIMLDELGGVTGVGEFVRKLVHEPVIREGHEARKAILYAALVKCMEVSVQLDIEARKIEASKEALKHKSLSKFSEDDLKSALGPLILETLTKRPEVGVKALRQAGYVVEKTPKTLANAIKRRDERFKREFMREMMKD
jgi:hypothetical protein